MTIKEMDQCEALELALLACYYRKWPKAVTLIMGEVKWTYSNWRDKLAKAQGIDAGSLRRKVQGGYYAGQA